MANFCPKCGASIDDGAYACPFCGEVLGAAQQPQYQQPQQYQQQPQYQQPQQYQQYPQYQQQPQYQQPQQYQQQPQVVVQQVMPMYSTVVVDPSWPVKSKTTAGLLGIFLGGLGIHKFYLGKVGLGIVYILFCWTTIPAWIGFIEGIIYLTQSDADFQTKNQVRIG